MDNSRSLFSAAAQILADVGRVAEIEGARDQEFEREVRTLLRGDVAGVECESSVAKKGVVKDMRMLKAAFLKNGRRKGSVRETVKVGQLLKSWGGKRDTEEKVGGVAQVADGAPVDVREDGEPWRLEELFELGALIGVGEDVSEVPAVETRVAKTSTRRESVGDRQREIEELIGLSKELDHVLGEVESGLRSKSYIPRKNGKRGADELETNQFAALDDQDVSDFHQRVPQPALRFGFELDDFQKRAILHLERHESVFVAAHTSAGKTVVAEYAIALAAASGGKVLYTSPIKSLSNQKFRDFRNKFRDVGIVTGDVSVNEESAQTIIMTTEILRSMLYRGADVIRDVSWVVYDEVQFVNDPERGVVWEESIIMLPKHIGIIMLSATVPNALEFASWVGKTKDRRVAVVSTFKRPVPLAHSLLHKFEGADGGLKATLLLAQGGHFLGSNFRAARRQESGCNESGSHDDRGGRYENPTSGRGRGRGRGHGRGRGGGLVTVGSPGASRSHGKRGASASSSSAHNESNRERYSGTIDSSPSTSVSSQPSKGSAPPRRTKNKSVWDSVVQYLTDKALTPTVLFCFSKKKCGQAVQSLEHFDLLPAPGDKAHVHNFFEQALQRLREEDRNLPQLQSVRENLKRGISAHHAGLLPIIKEVTEILFSKGLVKILFATETFAMGVNMPARSVVFTGVRKHDGQKFRLLQAGEYTQMSGRAGRRGLDSLGNVFLFFPPGDERRPTEEWQLRQVMTGEPLTLKSAFRLTYNMILNVLRVDELRVEEMMRRSFSEAKEENKMDSIRNVLEKGKDAMNRLDEAIVPGGGSDGAVALNNMRRFAEDYIDVCSRHEKLQTPVILPWIRKSIVVGRVVVVRLETGVLALGIVFSFPPEGPRGAAVTRGNGRPVAVTSRKQVLSLTSHVYVVTIVGTRSTQAQGPLPVSILLQPELVSREAGRLPKGKAVGKGVNKRLAPEIVSPNGLVLRLMKVLVTDILHVTSVREAVIPARQRAQSEASRRWHMTGAGQDAATAMISNAGFLDEVVSLWCQGPDHFPAAYEDAHGVPSSPARTIVAGSSAGLSKAQESRLKLDSILQEMVKSEGLAHSMCGHAPGVWRDQVVRFIHLEDVRSKLNKLKLVARTGSVPSLLPEYHKRVEVLMELGYVADDGLSVQLKGRCACEVATADSVVLTEIVLDNVLEGLEPAEVASLLSCLVCRQKNKHSICQNDSKKYSAEYCRAKDALRAVVTRVGAVQEKCGVELDFDIGDAGTTYESAICRWELAEGVLAWARGSPFAQVADMTDLQEGDIVVCIKRLSELLKDAQSVVKAVGNNDGLDHSELWSVLEESIDIIRRDIVFSGSLYLDGEHSVQE